MGEYMLYSVWRWMTSLRLIVPVYASQTINICARSSIYFLKLQFVYQIM